MLNDPLLAVIFYSFTLIGTFTIGYFVLRLSYPEIRTFEKSAKFATVCFISAAIWLTAFLVDYSITGDRAFSLDSLFFTMLFIVTAFYLVILRTFFLLTLSSQKFITIGMPVKAGSRAKPVSGSAKSKTILKQDSPKQIEIKPVTSVAKVEELKSNLINEPVEVKLEIKTISPVPVAATEQVATTVPKKSVSTVTAVAESPPVGFAKWKQARETEQAQVGSTKPVLSKSISTKTSPSKTKTAQSITPEKESEEKELQELVSTFTKEAKTTAATTPQGGPIHRRYLLTDQQVKVTADKNVSQKEEFGAMVQDIYSQLKDTKTTAKVSDVLKVDAPKQQTPSESKNERGTKTPSKTSAQASSAPASSAETGVSMSDILGTSLFSNSQTDKSAKDKELLAAESSASSSQSGGTDIFAQLSKATSGQPASAQSTSSQPAPAASSSKSDVSFVQIQAEQGMGCPTCKSKSSKIIFCPYCGTGMCANCSPSIKPIGPGQFIYTCPKCKEEVNVKKKAGS